MRHALGLPFFLVLLTAQLARAQFDSGSNGSDGPFNPAANTIIDLSLAGSGPGTGVYDPVKWAVVFNYTTINIPSGVSITFKNHPSHAPVVWLASGNINLAGTVNSNGGQGVFVTDYGFSDPGPGGFGGGSKSLGTAPATGGFGPGGGIAGQGGSYATGAKPYGNVQILPLIGGSGGGRKG